MVTKEQAHSAFSEYMDWALANWEGKDTSSYDDRQASVDAMTVLKFIEQSQRVPEKISDYGHPDYSEVWGYYMEGWNDCIDEMLATAPKPGGK